MTPERIALVVSCSVGPLRFGAGGDDTGDNR